MEKFLKVLKNYYVVFSVSLLCVLVTVLMYGMKNYREYTIKKEALSPPKNIIEVISDSPKENTKTNEIKKEEPVANYETSEEIYLNEYEEVSLQTNEEFEIIYPVNSEIIKGYSSDKLVFSKTFEDYRTHKGVDFLAENNKDVYCVFNGFVEEVSTNEMEGKVIVINHNNGYKSIYKNLSDENIVNIGDIVEKGQIIATVGENGIFESKDPAHLHFEITKDGANENPEDFLN
ncbi:MAG: M23 family metallopeptidase [Clostridia bacterium]|nr:M23 family metallopeptidase [Clostridia bacterium]